MRPVPAAVSTGSTPGAARRRRGARPHRLMHRMKPIRIALVMVIAASLATCASHGQAPAPPMNRFVVVLDPAHGGDDSGAELAGPAGEADAEKDFTLALGVRLRSLLAARGIQVATTRESDLALTADQRAQIANHAAAQACLVLHGTAAGTGVHLFLSSLPPVQPTRFAPWKTAQASWVARSLALAGVLNSALLHAGATVTLGRTALTTVDSMACPAVAVEVAPESPAKSPSGKPSGLNDPAYQARIADALVAGLLEWREEERQP